MPILRTDLADAHERDATTLLVNYLEAIAKKAGMPWDADYTAEVAQAVNHIVMAATITVREEFGADFARLKREMDRIGDAVDERLERRGD